MQHRSTICQGTLHSRRLDYHSEGLYERKRCQYNQEQASCPKQILRCIRQSSKWVAGFFSIHSWTLADSLCIVETVVFGYHKLDKRSRIIDTLELYMDPILRYSTGVWADVPSNALAKLDDLGIDHMAAIHAAG